MKFYKPWIKKYLSSNINNQNISKILNNYGFESNITNISIPHKLSKILFLKIISYKILKNNKFAIIYIEYNKKIIKLFIINKYNLNKKYIFIKKPIKKTNKIFNIKYKNKQYIIFKKKKNFIYIYKYIEKNSILEIKIPNNRIDCNNILGLSRELSILTNKKLKFNYYKKINIKIAYKNKITKIFYVKNNIIKNYKYIIIKNIKLINPIINKNLKYNLDKIGFKNNFFLNNIIYQIIIESGQIINLFDLDKIINTNIIITLDNKNNLIYKYKKNCIYKNYTSLNKIFYPNLKTKNILIFAPLLKTSTLYKIINNKDITNKYISNFDNNIQTYFINKISNLLEKKLLGKKKKIFIKKYKKIKNNKIIKLKFSKIENILGFNIKSLYIINIIKKIGFKILKNKINYLEIKPPQWRKDLNLIEEITEEIIKIYGYNKIPKLPIKTNLTINQPNKYKKYINNIKKLFIHLGYNEIINFCFSNENKEFFYIKNTPKQIRILNPISEKMSIMRTSLIPGIMDSLIYNIKRQNENIKIFEIGTCFYIKENTIKQKQIMSAMIYGYKYNNHWDIKKNILYDFYDIKGDLEFILLKNNKINLINLEISKYNILEKNLNINIKIKNKNIGYIGRLNKKIQNKLKIKYPIFLFEIKLDNLPKIKINKIKKISKYTFNKRDITLIIDQYIPINKIINECYLIDKKKIKNISVTKIFSNKEIKKNKKKNITISLVIQDKKKTLKEKEINKIINKCKKILKLKFNAFFSEELNNY